MPASGASRCCGAALQYARLLPSFSSLLLRHTLTHPLLHFFCRCSQQPSFASSPAPPPLFHTHRCSLPSCSLCLPSSPFIVSVLCLSLRDSFPFPLYSVSRSHATHNPQISSSFRTRHQCGPASLVIASMRHRTHGQHSRLERQRRRSIVAREDRAAPPCAGPRRETLCSFSASRCTFSSS